MANKPKNFAGDPAVVATFIAQIYDRFSNQARLDPSIVWLSKEALFSATQSFIDDLKRFCEYHDSIETPNDIKQAAYIVKWLIYNRPIQLKAEPTSVNTNYAKPAVYLIVNEVFSTYCALALLEIKHGSLPKLVDHQFLYSLKHRSFEAHTLISTFKAWKAVYVCRHEQ